MIQFIDVSSYIHAGMKTEFGSRAQYKGIPTGGIYGVLQQIAMCIRNNDIPVLCFDSPTNLREILPEYKGSRSRDPNVRFQQDIVYKYIHEAVPNSFKIPNLEADSVAYNIAEQNRGKIKQGFCYRTTDYDWCHNIVDDNDTMKPAVKGFMEIYKDNFEKVFSCKLYNVPLNSITAQKVFFGDTSDHVKPLQVVKVDKEKSPKPPYTVGLDGVEADKERAKYLVAYNIYCTNNKLDRRNKESFLEFIDKIKGVFADYDYVLRRAEVLYPQELKDKEHLTLSMKPVDVKGLTKVCSLTGCKSIASKLGIPFYEDMGDSQRDLLSEYRNKYLIEKTKIFESKIIAQKQNDIVIPDRGGFIL